MTDPKPKRKRFKTCLGCPFYSNGCDLVRVRVDQDVFPGGGWKVPRPIEHQPRGRPPEWCPLRKRPVLVELMT